MNMTRQDHIEFDRNYCANYAPQPGQIQKDYCALGCGASERMSHGRIGRDSELRRQGEMIMPPCIGGHNVDNILELCPKWERRSIEHAEKRADGIERALKNMAMSNEVVSKWRTWSDKNRVSKEEVIECPVCKGRLHLSQSSYNGHVHGRCETEECLNWME